MTDIQITDGAMRQTADIQKYYQYHAHIYDVTRWSFLFGRNALIRNLPGLPQRPHILEIGCGTGYNLRKLRKQFPQAHLTGIDLSRAMLQKASRKLTGDPLTSLICGSYGSKPLTQSLSQAQSSFAEDHAPNHEKNPNSKAQTPPFDLILLSYSLTIRSNNVEPLLNTIFKDLHPGGYIAVVDFHETPSRSFQSWMHINNVILNGSLLPLLQHYFPPQYMTIRQACFGLWSYFKYIGRKPKNIKDN